MLLPVTEFIHFGLFVIHGPTRYVQSRESREECYSTCTLKTMKLAGKSPRHHCCVSSLDYLECTRKVLSQLQRLSQHSQMLPGGCKMVTDLSICWLVEWLMNSIT